MRRRTRQYSVIGTAALGALLVGTLLPQAASAAKEPRYTLAFVAQPTAVAVSPALEATSGVYTARTQMCDAVTVEVQDADGERVENPSLTVTLSSSAGLSGVPLVAETVDGVATFGAADGTCTGGLAAGVVGSHVITATAPRAAAGESANFAVLQYLGDCQGCSLPELSQEDTAASLTTVQGQDTGGTDLTFALGVDAWTADMDAVCATDNSRRDQVVTVDLLSHVKTVTLRWSKQAVQEVSDNGSATWPVCMAAQYAFPTTNGSAGAVGDLPGWYAGALLPCRDVDPETQPCIASLTKTQRGEQLAVVTLPNVPGDPRFV